MPDTKSGNEIMPSKYRVRPTFEKSHSLQDELADLKKIRGRGFYDNHDDLDYEDDPDAP